MNRTRPAALLTAVTAALLAVSLAGCTNGQQVTPLDPALTPTPTATPTASAPKADPYDAPADLTGAEGKSFTVKFGEALVLELPVDDVLLWDVQAEDESVGFVQAGLTDGVGSASPIFFTSSVGTTPILATHLETGEEIRFTVTVVD
jgi:hypothetical protein